METAATLAAWAAVTTAAQPAFRRGLPPPPPDRGRYFRAMFMTLISDDGALSDFQT